MMSSKKLLLAITIIFSYLSAVAQQEGRVYFTSSGEKTNHPEIAVSYAIIVHLPEDSIWSVKEYDMNNVILSSGYYRDEQMTVPHGKFIYYEQKSASLQNDTSLFDKITSVVRLTGYYVEGVKTGIWLDYSNGTKSGLATYQKNMLNGLYQTFNIYTGKVLTEGYYVNGIREGDWCLLDADSTAIYTDVYAKGKVRKHFSYINEAVLLAREKEYEKNNKRAVPNFDFETLVDRTFQYYSFPIATGKFMMSCTITTEGKVANIKVVQAFETQFDDLAMQAISHTRWKPATIKGVPVNQIQNFIIEIVDHKISLPRGNHKNYNFQTGSYQ